MSSLDIISLCIKAEDPQETTICRWTDVDGLTNLSRLMLHPHNPAACREDWIRHSKSLYCAIFQQFIIKTHQGNNLEVYLKEWFWKQKRKSGGRDGGQRTENREMDRWKHRQRKRDRTLETKHQTLLSFSTQNGALNLTVSKAPYSLV